MRTYFLSVLGGCDDHRRGGLFVGASVGVGVEETGGGDLYPFGIEDYALDVNKEAFIVLRDVA